MADSRDITGKNRKFTGTTGVKLPEGTTAQRVNEQGQLRFNTSTNLAEYYDGTDWKPIDAPPTITGFTLDGGSSVTTTEIDEDAAGDATIVISGSNFDATSGTVVFEPESGGANVSTQTLTRTNSSSFTVTVTRGDFVQANGPYAIKLTNGSGLAATLASALTTANEPPAFNTAAGSLGNIFDGNAIASKDAGATDADGDTITYSISAGALPSGLSLNTSTGAITGTPSGNSDGTFTFTVQAATTFHTVTREFTLTQVALPSGGTVTTSGDYRIHTFTSSGTFTNTVSSLSAEYLVVAGGGGSRYDNSGGGGAGGYRTNVPGQTSGRGSSAEAALSLTTGSKTVTIGGGGAGGPSSIGSGNSGSNSVFDTITSIGGGGGGSQNVAGNSGGSGGGDGHSGGPLGDRNTGGTGTSGQGYDGGGGRQGPTHPAGGGGGAGGNGGTPPNGTSPGGAGGSGLSSTITGSSVTRAGGGSGSSTTPGGNRPSPGGGGGVGSGVNNTPGGNGTANTGGGGGGGSDTSTGGNGGSGIVIVRYDTTTI